MYLAVSMCVWAGGGGGEEGAEQEGVGFRERQAGKGWMGME